MKHLFKSMLVGLLAITMIGCTNKGSSAPKPDNPTGSNEKGKYTCYSYIIDNIEFGSDEDETIELSGDGKIEWKSAYEVLEGTYTLKNEKLTVNFSEGDYTGTLKNGLAILDSGNGIIASFAKEGITPPDITPDANIDPSELDFGFEYLFEDPECQNEDQTLPQFWYIYGAPNTNTYVWFHSMGMLVYGEDGEEVSYNYDIKDKHIVDKETGGENFDFVFHDQYTAYECVEGVTWARANEPQMAYYLSANKWQTDEGDVVYTFYPDGTFEQHWEESGQDYSGIWYMEDGNHIITANEDGTDPIKASVFYDRKADSFEIRGLCEAGQFYYTPVE